MKKVFAIGMVLVVIAMMLVACGTINTAEAQSKTDEEIVADYLVAEHEGQYEIDVYEADEEEIRYIAYNEDGEIVYGGMVSRNYAERIGGNS